MKCSEIKNTMILDGFGWLPGNSNNIMMYPDEINKIGRVGIRLNKIIVWNGDLYSDSSIMVVI